MIEKFRENWKGLPGNEPFDIAKAIAYAAGESTLHGTYILYCDDSG
jgi:hypothetical protein